MTIKIKNWLNGQLDTLLNVVHKNKKLELRRSVILISTFNFQVNQSSNNFFYFDKI